MDNYGAIQQRGFLSKKRGGTVTGITLYDPIAAISAAKELINLETMTAAIALADGSSWLVPVIDRDLSTPPGAPVLGDRYIVKTPGAGGWAGINNEEIVEYNGATWDTTVPTDGQAVVETDSGKVLTYDIGTHLWAIDAALVAYLPLAGGHMAGTIYMDSSRILNHPNCVYSSEPANKAFVDRYKVSHCRLATTTNIVALTGALTIDGVAVVTNDRILVKDQTTTVQNGIYLANTAGAWTRALDMQSSAVVDFHKGMTIAITDGDANAGKMFIQTTADGKVTVNSMAFVQMGDQMATRDWTNTAIAAAVAGLGGGDQVTEVRCATTVNITLGAPPATLDGVTLQTNDRILVKNQTNKAENGIYDVSLVAGCFRAADMDDAAEATVDTWCFIKEGTTLGDTGWKIFVAPAVIDINDMEWEQFSGGSGAIPPPDFTEEVVAGAPKSIFNLTWSYTVATHAISVYLNGQLLSLANSDYTETNSTRVTLGAAAQIGDVVTISRR